jgi:hydrogenase nickel incorporation protein HypA/HybF
MHEFSIAYDIYATAKKAAIEHSATRVKKVSVSIGEMTMINPEQVKFLFDTLCEEDPLFTGVVLDYQPAKVLVRCRCGYEGDNMYACPNCGALPEVIEGREVVVTNIEIEVDDE